MTAYYNEIDAFAAAWLRNLINAGLIAAGDVDERSIKEVTSDDVKKYTQCHFFAGIGGWSAALKLALWDDARPVWTGSCPCQPFSAAGKGLGVADERHLWPEFLRLISECRPATIFGEQVASKAGRDWLAGVRADLEALGYAAAGADLCAASVGAPHIRQRLWRVGHAANTRLEGHAGNGDDARRRSVEAGSIAASGEFGRMADADGRNTSAEGLQRGGEQRQQPEDGGAGGGLAHAVSERGRSGEPGGEDAGDARQSSQVGWGDFYIRCADGKARRVEPGTFPLAHGVPNRVGRLRAYGNAIVPQVAAEVIGAFMECRP